MNLVSTSKLKNKSVTVRAPIALAMLSVMSFGQVSASEEANLSVKGYVTTSNDLVTVESDKCLKSSSWNKKLASDACGDLSNDSEAGTAPRTVTTVIPSLIDPNPVESLHRLEARALFEFDSAQLNRSQDVALTNFVEDLKEYDEIKSINVVGHTDSIGSKNYNYILSLQRAHTVRTVLMKAFPDVSIEVAGRGEDSPVATNETNEGRLLNRRVEVEVITKSDLKPDPVMPMVKIEYL